MLDECLARQPVGTPVHTAYMSTDTWNDRDLPVLRAVVDIYERDGHFLTRASDIERETGLDEETVQRALRALNSVPSHFEKVIDSSGGDIVMVGPPTAHARRMAGAWPTPDSMLEQLVSALEEAGSDPDRPEAERSKFKQVARWLASGASQVAIGALGGAGGNILSG